MAECALFLTTQVMIFKSFLIEINIRAFKIIKQLTSGVNLTDQTVTGAVIFLIYFKVLGQHQNFTSKNRNLNFAGTCIALVALELLPYGFFINLTHNMLCGP